MTSNIFKIKIVVLFYIFIFFVSSSGVLAADGGESDVITGGDYGGEVVVQDTAKAAPVIGSFTYKTLVRIPGLGTEEPQPDGTKANVVTISPNSLGLYLQTIFNYIIGLAIALATVMIIYGGVRYSTTDALGGKKEGKAIVQDALWGLALALGSYLILNTINPDLLKFDLDLPKVEKIDSSVGGAVDPARLQVITDIQNGQAGGGTGTGATLLNVSGSALQYRAQAIAIGRANGLDGKVFACQIARESHFNPAAGSPKGAQGIAQILPSTAASSCPGININTVEGGLTCGARIMKQNKATYAPNYARALAAYNGGARAAEPTTQCAAGTYAYQCQIDRQGRPVANSYGETRNYIADISACARANGASI